ncbi:MAG: hypothetical protein KDA25_03515, partial [Phycisphaerales bacterium]|nr:hypothetical protein [Phycisphaerales bacterium]
IRGHAADIEAPIRWWLADALLSLADETTDRCLLTMHLVRLSLDDPPLEAMATELLALLPDTRALLDDPMPCAAPDPTDDAGRILRLADRLVLAERFLPLLVAGACRRMDPGAARLAAAIGSALTRFRDPGAAAMALLRLDLRLGHADAARDWATCIMRWWPEAIGLTPGLEEAPRPQARLAA